MRVSSGGSGPGTGALGRQLLKTGRGNICMGTIFCEERTHTGVTVVD